MRLFLFAVVVLLCHAGYSQSAADSLLRRLDLEIEKRPTYEEAKLRKIESLKTVATKSGTAEKYAVYTLIYDEYKSFIYDSAFLYVRHMHRIALGLRSPQIIAATKIKVAFILVSSGMFNEALDTLQSVKTYNLPDSL